MEEEALLDSYKQFTDTGYKGSIEDFKTLLSSNKDALLDAHKLFTDTGYKGDLASFVNLVGVKKKDSSEDIGPKTELDSAITQTPVAGSSGGTASTPLDLSGKDVQYTDTQEQPPAEPQSQNPLPEGTDIQIGEPAPTVDLKEPQPIKTGISKIPNATQDQYAEAELEQLKENISQRSVVFPLVDKYDEATKITEEDKELAKRKSEDKLSGTFLEGVISFATETSNILDKVMSFGLSKPKPAPETYKEEKLKDAEVELKKEGLEVSLESIEAKAKEISVQNELDEIKSKKVTKYVESLDEDTKKALEVDKIYKYQTLEMKEKSKLMEMQIDIKKLKDIEGRLSGNKDLIKKIKEEGKNVPESLINLHNEKVTIFHDIQRKWKDYRKELEKNNTKLISEAEAIDVIKRNYSTLDNIGNIAREGLIRAYGGAIGGSAYIYNITGAITGDSVQKISAKKLAEESQDVFNTIEEVNKGYKDRMTYDKIDGFFDVGYFMMQETVAQTSTIAQITAAGVPGIIGLGFQSGGEKFAQMKDEENNGIMPKHYSLFQEITAPVLYGTAEALLGAAPTAAILKRSVSGAGRQLLKDGALAHTKQFTKDLGWELTTEMATTWSQNGVDRFILEDKSVTMLRNMDHTAFQTLGSMPVMLLGGRAIGEAIKHFTPKTDIETIRKNLSEIESLNQMTLDLEDKAILPEIKKKIKALEKANKTILVSTTKKLSKVEEAEFKKIREISTRQAELQIKAEKVTKDRGISKNQRKSLLEILHKEFTSLENTRNSILEGNGTIDTLLSEEEVLKLRNKAEQQLQKEKDTEGTGKIIYNITEKEIADRATEIYNEKKINETKAKKEEDTKSKKEQEILSKEDEKGVDKGKNIFTRIKDKATKVVNRLDEEGRLTGMVSDLRPMTSAQKVYDKRIGKNEVAKREAIERPDKLVDLKKEYDKQKAAGRDYANLREAGEILRAEGMLDGEAKTKTNETAGDTKLPTDVKGEQGDVKLIKPTQQHKKNFKDGNLSKEGFDGIVAYAHDKKLRGKKLTSFENDVIMSNIDRATDIQMKVEDAHNKINRRDGATKETTPPVEPKKVDLAKDLKLDTADEILGKLEEQLKDFGKETLGMNIPVAVMTGAVQAMRVAVKTAKTTADVLSTAINYLKGTAWYKGLNTKQKTEAENSLIDELNKVLSGETKEDIRELNEKEKVSNFETTKRFLGQFFTDKLFNFKNLTKNLKGFDDFLHMDSVWQSRAAGRATLIKGLLTDILEDAKKKKVGYKQLSDWLMANHAKDRNKYIQENVNELNPYGSGLNNTQIEEILNVSPERKKVLDKLSERVYKIIEGNRKRMLESGLIDEDVYQSLSETKSYVPLTNFDNEEIEVAHNRQNKTVTISGKEFFEAKGRKSKAGNILANVLMQATSTEIRAAKNEFLNTIYDMVLKNEESGLGKIFSGKSRPTNGNSVISPPVYVGIKVKGVQKWVEFKSDVLANNIQNTTDYQVSKAEQRLGMLNNYFRAVITTYNPEFMLGNFPRDLETAIIHLQGQKDINASLNGKNITVDAVKGVPTAIKTILAFKLGKHKHEVDSEWTKSLKEFIEDGGETGWTEQTPYEDILKSFEKIAKAEKVISPNRVIRKFGHYIESLNSAVENGIRFSSYRAAVKAGASRNAAASLSKELTVNFNRKGEAGTLLNIAYLFSNTAIQGTTTMYRNLSKLKTYKDKDGNEKRGLTGAQKFAGALVTFGALAPLLNRGISGEEEESGELYYDMIPEWVKERNIIIMINEKDYVTIPLPYGYNVFYNFGEATSDMISGHKDAGEASQYVLGSILGSFSPIPAARRDTPLETAWASIVPTEPLRFGNEISSNKNYNNMDIYREAPIYSKGDVPDSGLGKSSTPNWAKWMTGLMNDYTGGSEFKKGIVDINPETLIYTIHRAGGGVSKLLERSFTLGTNVAFNLSGKNTTEVGDTIKEEYGVNDKRDIHPHTIPFVRRYFGESQDVYFSGEFYKIQNDVYTDFNVKKDEMDKKGITKEEQISPKEVKEVQIIKDNKKVIDDANERLKTIREAERKFTDKFTNSKDLQAAINAANREKYIIYKKVFRYYKESQKKLKGLKKN